jgi:hypothetical protein
MSYIFNFRPNSYFQGQDLRCERTDTHDLVLLNIKDGMWAVNVKDDLIFSQYPADVQHAANVLPEGVIDGIAERVKDDWWREADHMAEERGFSGAFQAGRSGGWCAIGGTEHFEGADMIAPAGEDMESERDKFLALAFMLDDLTEAHEKFFSEVRAAMQALQIELSEYAEWVGAEVQTLDGPIITVAKLNVVNGRAALYTGRSGFAFATEAKLVRKADGNIPARITADPIMEQVFQIIEGRANLTKEQIDGWLDANDDNDPTALYEEHVAPAVNAIEDEILAHNEEDHG